MIEDIGALCYTGIRSKEILCNLNFFASFGFVSIWTAEKKITLGKEKSMRFQTDEEYIKTGGRTIYRDGVRYLGYSGTSVSFRFVGKKASAHILSDPERRERINWAWLAVFVDGGAVPFKRFVLDRSEADYILYESEEEKEVTVTIVKYTEPEYAVCGIAWIETDSEKVLAPPPAKQRKIQMIGDSITCGYGLEGDVLVEELRTEEENPVKAYSLQTAGRLDADVEIIAWNGKGVITAYVGDGDEKEDSWLIPMLYQYTDAGCERDYFHRPENTWEKWEHSRFEPDIITIFLGTNDASYTREFTDRQKEFVTEYLAFLEEIHAVHPQAAILCMLGTMDQRLCPSVKDAVQEFSKRHKEVRIEYLHLPLQEETDGLGTFWHPSEVTHGKVANLAVAKIKEMMDW